MPGVDTSSTSRVEAVLYAQPPYHGSETCGIAP